MISIERLTKRYGNKTVYENFSLEIAEGERTCILGESGSGKTTLLNCIAGLTEFSGSVTAKKCSYVFQTPRLVPCLTVRGNLSLVNSCQNKIDAVLNELQILDKAESYPCALSGGQAQRVALARAILFGGEIMLMDEPFSSLDLKLKIEMRELYKNFQRETASTVVFVTHDIDDALCFGERIIVIKDGKTVFDERNRENLRERLISALLGLDNNF